MELFEGKTIDEEIDILLQEALLSILKKKKEEKHENKSDKMDDKIKWANQMLRKSYNARDKLYKMGYNLTRISIETDNDNDTFDLMVEGCKKPGGPVKTIYLDKNVDIEYRIVVSAISNIYKQSLGY